MGRKILILTACMCLIFSVCVSAQEMLRIILPQDGSEVTERPTVSIETQDRNANVWVFVNPIGTNGNWVQPAVPKVSEGRWESSIYIGRPGTIDVGKSFLVMAVVNCKNELAEVDKLNSWPKCQWKSKAVRVIRVN